MRLARSGSQGLRVGAEPGRASRLHRCARRCSRQDARHQDHSLASHDRPQRQPTVHQRACCSRIAPRMHAHRFERMTWHRRPTRPHFGRSHSKRRSTQARARGRLVRMQHLRILTCAASCFPEVCVFSSLQTARCWSCHLSKGPRASTGRAY